MSTEETVTSSKGGGVGRGTRKKVPKFTDNDKENFNIYGEDVGLNKNKSPLPVGFPRAPLQDITAILRPLNSNSDEEDRDTGEVRKPVTRSQGLRKFGNVHTTALSERISKNVNRSGPSKTRKKQVMKIAVDESKVVTLAADAGQLKQETTHTLQISSSVNVEKHTLKVEEHTQKAEEQTQKAEEQTQKAEEGSQKTEKQEEKTNEQKRRKPLSERSSVSRFR